MTEEATASPKRRFSARGCLLRVAIGVAVLVAVVVAIGTIFNQGDNADQPSTGFVAGNVTAFAPASVNYFEQQHIFLTRLQDGTFIALYDRSSRQQELGGTCRVRYDETAGVGTLAPLPGLLGAFVEDCNAQARAVWRLDGTFAFGNGYGDLDRMNTSTSAQGDVTIDTQSRTCTRSRGVLGIAPFEKRTCGSPD
jgi:hypothetical protein